MQRVPLGHAIAELRRAFPFPDPHAADAHGLLAWGGDLRAERLIAAYASGVFPWYERDPILWFCPDPRWVLVPSELHVSKSLAKMLRRAPFALRFDTAFEAVMRACAEVPRPGQSGTWITPDMVQAYGVLHRMGLAHSIEAWDGDELVGGAYGVALGAAFFGESMFTRRRDASKVAFVTLVRQLERFGFEWIDCQVHTPHLERFGARPWPRERFLERVASAVEKPTLRGRWSVPLDAGESAGR